MGEIHRTQFVQNEPETHTQVSVILERVYAALKEKGYTFVPLSELIYRDGYHMNHEGRQIKN